MLLVTVPVWGEEVNSKIPNESVGQPRNSENIFYERVMRWVTEPSLFESIGP